MKLDRQGADDSVSWVWVEPSEKPLISVNMQSRVFSVIRVQRSRQELSDNLSLSA